MNDFNDKLDRLKQILNGNRNVEFSLLFGSRARGDATEMSDWDFAMWFSEDANVLDRLGLIEGIRNLLAKVLGLSDDLVQIVDLRRADLSISNTIVEEGVIVTGDNTMALANFFTRTWALVEDFQWRQRNESRNLSAASS